MKEAGGYGWRMSRVLLILVRIAYGLIAFIAITITLMIIMIETPVCNIHGHQDSRSPDGVWRARWTTTGCSRFFLTIFWHSKIVVSNTTYPATASYLIFKSDSPHGVTFDWLPHNILHIEVNHVANITRSKRHLPGLTVSYGVRSSALRYASKFVAGETVRINRLKANHGSAGAHLDAEDRQAEQQVDSNFRDYLERFLKWSRTYAQPPD